MGQNPMAWINPVYTACLVSPTKIEPSLWLFSHLLDIKVNIWTTYGMPGEVTPHWTPIKGPQTQM